MSDQTPLSQYLLFDFNGQKVAVTDMTIDETGLRTSWVVLGETRHYTDEQTDRLLQQAFADLFNQMEEAPEPDAEPTPEPVEEPIPTPTEKVGFFKRMATKFRELF